MSSPPEPQTARELLLDLLSRAECMNRGTTPEDVVQDAINEALLNQPSLRTCLVPGCLRQYDAVTTMTGKETPRPEWSGKGWHTLGSGTIFPAGGHICPDHVAVVTAHLPRRVKLPNDRWTVDCACGWMPTPQTWHGVLRALWEQHLLQALGTLPAAPPAPEDGLERLPLAEHTEDTLRELYETLEDTEYDRRETRDAGQAMYKSWDWHRRVLGGVSTALASIRNTMATDPRDWAAERRDAWLWGVLMGWGCSQDHTHDDEACDADNALLEVAKKHGWNDHRVARVRELRTYLAPITDPQPKETAT
ncbi:hypothetical protein [Streptomyces bottropensis]|uniref:hypothetical protein n=1 Tax=Streptomyces bottropensis TaxID=42235 RepID=UPI0036BE4C3E